MFLLLSVKVSKGQYSGSSQHNEYLLYTENKLKNKNKYKVML